MAISINGIKTFIGKNILTLLFFIAATSVLVFIFTYFFQFHGDLSHESDDWGNFGSFMGGLGSVFGLASLYLLITTYKLQSTELKATRDMAQAQSDFQREEAEKKEYYAAMELLDKQLELYFDRKFEVESTHPSVSMVTKDRFVSFRRCLENSAPGASNYVIPRKGDRVMDVSTLYAFEDIARLIEQFSSILSDYESAFKASITTAFYRYKYQKTAAKLSFTGYTDDKKASYFLKR